MRKWKCIYTKYPDEYTVGKIYETDDNEKKITNNNGVGSCFKPTDFSKHTLVFEEIKEEDKKVRERSIHITTDGTTTHAVLKYGKDVIKRAKVGLYHTDEYKFETGVMEVVKKLLDVEDDKNNGNFSVKCTKNDLFDTGLTVGKIYTFVDGYSKWNSGNKFPQDKTNGIDRFRNIDDLNKWLNDKSYEFELVESEESKSLSDYTTDELLDEVKRRVK